MKKTIAVIGAAERMGSTLAFALAAAGYCVLLSEDFEKRFTPLIGKLPFQLAKIRLMIPQADARIVLSIRDASWEADIIISVVPREDQTELARKIKDYVTGKIIVSVTNPLRDSCDGLASAPKSSAAEELVELFPHSKIVKAFKTDSFSDFKMPQNAVRISDVSVAGDDPEAVSTTMQLIKDVGFNPLFAGQITMCPKQQDTVYKSDRLSPQLGPK